MPVSSRRAVLHDRLQRREAELERLAERTIELQELDRRRIAGDIHDGITQRLVSAWYHLRAAISLTTDPDVTEELTATAALLSEALEDSRRAITGLRPALLDDLGLRAAITPVAASVGDVGRRRQPRRLHTRPARGNCAVPHRSRDAPERREACERVAVDVTLTDGGDAVTLTVTDDGVGFDSSAAPGPTSFGLAGVHERASLLGATLLVRSTPGNGTTVAVRLPANRASGPSYGDER